MKFLLTSDTHAGYTIKTHVIHEQFLKNVADTVKKEGITAVIHAGDWASNTQNQFKRSLKLFRKHLGTTPILAVRGNHDFWHHDKRYYENQNHTLRMPMFGQLNLKHKEWFKEFNIHHLEDGPFIVEDVIVAGFDGWYSNANPPTIDHKYIRQNIEGVWTNTWLADKAYKDLDKLLAMDLTPYKKKICVTHFPMWSDDPNYISMCANQRYLEFIEEKFDVLCVGHSHHYCDVRMGRVRLLNCGGTYDIPVAKIFEV